MAECTTGQKPYYVTSFSSYTKDGACHDYSDSLNSSTTFTHTYNVGLDSFGDEVCFIYKDGSTSPVYAPDIYVDCTMPVITSGSTPPVTNINCGSACTVALELKPAPADPEHFSDMTQLWSIFLVVAVVVFCARQLLKFFESSPNGEN